MYTCVRLQNFMEETVWRLSKRKQTSEKVAMIKYPCVTSHEPSSLNKSEEWKLFKENTEFYNSTIEEMILSLRDYMI